MQTSGVLLLFCTSAYWLLTETAPTQTTELGKILGYIKEIENHTFSEIIEDVSVPLNLEEKECFQKNLEIFMNATETIIKKHEEKGKAIYNTLKDIQAFSLPGCPPKGCDCEPGIFPFDTFKESLLSFLHKIRKYFSGGYRS